MNLLIKSVFSIIILVIVFSCKKDLTKQNNLQNNVSKVVVNDSKKQEETEKTSESIEEFLERAKNDLEKKKEDDLKIKYFSFPLSIYHNVILGEDAPDEFLSIEKLENNKLMYSYLNNCEFFIKNAISINKKDDVGKNWYMIIHTLPDNQEIKQGLFIKLKQEKGKYKIVGINYPGA